MNKLTLNEKQLEFIDYILSHSKRGKEKLPSIANIAKDLEVSTSNLRELITVAKTLGLVSIQPRTGISILPYDFSPAVSKSLYFAVKTDPANFDQFSDLRNEIEKAYFIKAVETLTEEDVKELFQIVDQAMGKLDNSPIQIPHEEHRSFHLSIYKNLKNIFIGGLLNSYWDLYDLVGLNTYTDITYLQLVWKYHRGIVVAISKLDFLEAYQLLSDHIELINQRENVGRSSADAKKDK